ncbi:HD-GYP domain-containing protein [Roseixanthobacter liquoris]|uniref:HD-GYP domain-containing protein n=1 Tax=Roseixanthobacter liquoris TaxID=3119921 RepID=UPI00372678F8
MQSLKPRNKGPAPTLTPLPEAAGIPLSELLGALSFALDLTEGQPEGHCVRACWIALAIARQIDLPREGTWELYYTVLLKDLGCSSNAARLCDLYLADDLAFKRGFKKVSGLPQILSFIVGQTGAGAPLAQRVAQLAHVVRRGKAAARDLIETRCHRGALIARRMRFPEPVAAGIAALDEHWDGGGLPGGMRGTQIPLYARIALLAQVADVFHAGAGPLAALEAVRSRAGHWFDPSLTRAFEDAAQYPGFWDALRAPDLAQHLFALEPAQRVTVVDERFLDDIVHGFASVIDAKSPFTAGHSERVALVSNAIAAELGIGAEHRRWIRRMALLHDIGKLGVSNLILDKPAALTPDERAAMERHASYTGEVLSRISAFRAFAPIAAAHHERLDGKGYPLGLRGDEIALETRILTVADIFDALSADRPYRAAMPMAQALDILRQGAGTVVDPHCLAALEAVIGRSSEADFRKGT